MAKKVCVVTKDKMEFNLYQPVVDILQKRGIEVVVVAEGLSMDLWLKAGYEIYGGLPKEGDFDPNIKTRTDIDPVLVLENMDPDVVMTGLASPIKLGESFGRIANQFGIGLGFVEDLWGVHQRSEARPDFICTLDAYGEKKILEHVEYDLRLIAGDETIDCQCNPPDVYVTGSPAMDSLQNVKSDPSVGKAIREANPKRVILLGGQGEATTPMVRGVVETLNAIPDKCVVIPRFHPKYMSDLSKVALKDEWMTLLDQIKPPHVVLWIESSVNTHSLILSSTEVVSIFSNLLIEAVVLGRMAVSWNSEVGQKSMKKSLGEESFPLCQFGAVQEVWNPTGYLNQVPGFNSKEYSQQITDAQKVVKSDGKNALRVAEAIIAHL